MNVHRLRTGPSLPRFIRTLLVLTVFAALTVLTIIAGCAGESTKPGRPATGIPRAEFDVNVDPAGASFVLTRVPGIPSGQAPVEVELIGSNLVTDSATETVSLDVSIRNVSRVGLSSPAQVVLSDFAPAAVEVLNADFADSAHPAADGAGFAGARRFGFDYTAQLGSDGVLSPGETSQSRAWLFRVPGLEGFSFAAVAAFGVPSGGPVIAGFVFRDLNGNGARDPDDPPYSGRIILQRPDGTIEASGSGEDGAYSLSVRDVGLHTLTLEPARPGCPCEVVPTTPNPLRVVLVSGEDGQTRSYLHANFGLRIVSIGEVMPVVLTDLPPREIRQNPYRLDPVGLDGDLLALRVGFSGCTPFHEFTLFLSGGFMESNPVRARLVLGHNDLGEPCDAAFERTLRFDLTPVRQAFEHAYGQPGPLLLLLTDLQGNEHVFRYRWGPPPSGRNLLPNGSFERGGQPTLEGWEVINPALTSVVSGDAPGGGAWALRLEADWAPTTGYVRAPVVGVGPGRKLRLSAWVRAEGDLGAAMMFLQAGSWVSQTVGSEAPDWTRIELTAVPPVERGDTLWVVLSSPITEIARRSGLFDDVVLEELSADTLDSPQAAARR